MKNQKLVPVKSSQRGALPAIDQLHKGLYLCGLLELEIAKDCLQSKMFYETSWLLAQIVDSVGQI